MKKLVNSLIGLLLSTIIIICSVSFNPIEIKAATPEVQIVAEYTYPINNNHIIHFIVVHSNSTSALYLSSNSIAYDAAGNIIGAGTGDGSVIRSGHDELIREDITDLPSVPALYNTQISYKVLKHSEDAAASVIIQPTVVNDKIVVTCTNAGTLDAKYFEVTALFFKNGQLIDYYEKYINDAEDQLKAGSTLSGDLYCTNGEFDNYLIYSQGIHY